MPTATTMGTAGGTSATTEGAQSPQVSALVPFIRASGLHREIVDDRTVTLTSADQDQQPIPINAYGYLRSLWVVVTTSSAGSGWTSAAYSEDGPWNALKNLQVLEPNGATLFQVSSGVSGYFINKYGGYRYGSDPACSPTYGTLAASLSATAPSTSFAFRIPLEINLRDALGSLPNQNSGAQFQFKYTVAKQSDPFAGTPGTGPSIRIQTYLEAWDQPETATAGQTNQTTPPAMNTTQYWSEQVYAVNSGQFTVRLTRMGNYIRNLIFVYRRSASTRANGQSDFPDPATIAIDTRNVDYIAKTGEWANDVYERYGYERNLGLTQIANPTVGVNPGGLDNGVFPYSYCWEFDGRVGFENRDLWLPTLSSTRYEISGSFANAGTLTVLTNDVSVVGDVFL